jgi:hypothetical protein
MFVRPREIRLWSNIVRACRDTLRAEIIDGRPGYCRISLTVFASCWSIVSASVKATSHGTIRGSYRLIAFKLMKF